MPTLYILVGVPGSGKSTWIKNQHFDMSKTAIVSTDDLVEKYATSVGKTYSEVFDEYMPQAVAKMAGQARAAFRAGMDVVWDQTSTSVGSRAKKIRMCPTTYKIVAVVFDTPEKEELARRLGSRPGKNIPDHVMRQMISSYQPPTTAEGIDEIIKGS